MRTRGPRSPFLCLAVALAASTSLADDPPARVGFVVRAGEHDRHGSIVRFSIPVTRLAPALTGALDAGPVALLVTDPLAPPGTGATVAQADRRPDGSIRLTWALSRPIEAGREARFEVGTAATAPAAVASWSAATGEGGRVEFRLRGRPAFTYNARPLASPDPGASPLMSRDAYIHPAYTPAGAVVTGDFSRFHPHHRGLFLAYTKTRWGTALPDFWNIQDGKGRIRADGSDVPNVGPVVASFAARHRWEAAVKGADGSTSWPVALRERWEVEAYDVPEFPGRLLDITSTQQAKGHPLELLPYRYGGMAFRSAEPSVKGPIDVLTAEGRHRLDGDGKPTRWVDLTGPIAEGSPNYAGAMIADHSSNPGYPNAIRIHPTNLPFFSVVPAHDRPLTIPVDRPTTFRYRILIHDGRPDPALDDRVAADFVDPPGVVLD